MRLKPSSARSSPGAEVVPTASEMEIDVPGAVVHVGDAEQVG